MKRALSLMGFSGLAFLIGTTSTVVLSSTIAGTEGTALLETAQSIADPTRLHIDVLGIDASIQPVGLTATGEMAVPDDWQEAGWYQFGAKPGEEGAAVIAGHFDSQTGPAIFWDLEQLQPGDTVAVTDEAGKEYVFTVTSSELFDTESAPLERIFKGENGKATLHLITCDGPWDEAKDRYAKRLVVFAKMRS